MSHFSVLAIQRKGSKQTIRSLLEPYDENLEVEPRIYKTKQELIDEEKSRLPGIINEDIVKEYLADPVKFKKEESSYKVNYVEKVLDEYYKFAAGSFTDEDYYRSAIEDEDPDHFDEDGNLMTTYNEDSKWDWYEVGGRWSGELILKNGSTADSAKFEDVDWAAMNKLSPDHEKDIRDYWRLIINKKGTDEEVKQFKDDHPFMPSERYVVEKYGTLEEHLRIAGLFSTFAVVDEKGWYEEGRMGWFGASSATPEEEANWTEDYEKNFIAGLDPEDKITVVDCHI